MRIGLSFRAWRRSGRVREDGQPAACGSALPRIRTALFALCLLVAGGRPAWAGLPAPEHCASFDFSSLTLSIPCIDMHPYYFSLDLLLPPGDSLRFTPVGGGTREGGGAECAFFTFDQGIDLWIPCLVLWDTPFRMKLGLASADPFMFEVKEIRQRRDESAFFVENLGVRFGPWDRASNRAGDFLFVPEEDKVFLEFGAVVWADTGGTKALPTFEYRMDPDADVFAIAEGTVVRMVFQEETADYEFTVMSVWDRAYQIGYDHVTAPTVSVGDVVAPGQILGKPGPATDTLGRFEIMINNTPEWLSYCPFAVFDPVTTQTFQDEVATFMDDWESFQGNLGIYDQSSQPYPGCNSLSMVTY